jgi:hypothetical protein
MSVSDNFADQIIAFWARKSSNTNPLRGHKEHKGRLKLLLFFSWWTLRSL